MQGLHYSRNKKVNLEFTYLILYSIHIHKNTQGFRAHPQGQSKKFKIFLPIKSKKYQIRIIIINSKNLETIKRKYTDNHQEFRYLK